MKRAIVNLSTSKFWKGQERLKERLVGLTESDTFFYMNENEVGAPPHLENNYEFKVHAINKIREMGYTSILWLDASMLPIKNIDGVFDIIEEDGYFMQYGGWKNSRWTNEKTKEFFGTSGGDMFSACCFGLDFTKKEIDYFWENVIDAMDRGLFNGSWDNHRHDQTIMSIIAYKLGMRLNAPDIIFEYAKDGDKPSKESILLFADGIC